MDNLLRQVASIRDGGVFTDTVAADRRAPVAAARDTAAAVAGLLLDRSWTGRGEVPVVGGPEDRSANDMARIITDMLRRPVRYERQSLDDFRAQLTGHGFGGRARRRLRRHDARQGQQPRRRRAAHPQTASPTTFRTWCEKVLEPAARVAQA